MIPISADAMLAQVLRGDYVRLRFVEVDVVVEIDLLSRERVSSSEFS